MASALVLADDGRREGGRWQYGHVGESSTGGKSWGQRLAECGVILDFAPEFALEVVAGTLTLNAACHTGQQDAPGQYSWSGASVVRGAYRLRLAIKS